SASSTNGDAPCGLCTVNTAGSSAPSSAVEVCRPESATWPPVEVVFDHPQAGPQLGVQLVAFAHLFHQPCGGAAAWNGVHGDVFAGIAATFADLAQARGTHEGDLLAAGAGGGGADHQHFGVVGGPAGFFLQLAHGRILDG